MISVCIIAIGDELLNGFTLDTNTQWLKEKISSTNATVVRSVIIPDKESSISNELDNSLMKKYDFIIITGGLGPTHDDITKQTLSDFLELPLSADEEHLGNLRNQFKKLLKVSDDTAERTMRDNMLASQSFVLDGFNPIDNKLGTALGMMGKENNSTIIVLPGVPKELKQMFRDSVLPNHFPSSKNRSVITLKTTGITESKLYLMLEDSIYENRKNFKFSFLPHFSGVNIRIIELNDNELDQNLIDHLKNKLGSYYYGQNNDTLDSIVSALLLKNNITISVAESCTGGLLSKKLTDYSGSSKYLIGSVVAYSNKIKRELLNVPKDILDSKGAVSSDVALIMSDNVTKLFNSDIGVSITGISGPGGGTVDKPIGLYYISLKYGEKHSFKKFIFNIEDRTLHREVVSNTALNLIRLILDES
tara:strand:- start:639 stop:1895 length:1257 start_codon:yes stop_codon:yes gene_type:complete